MISTIAMSLPRDTDRQAPLQLTKEASDSMSSHSDRLAVPGDSPAVYVGDPSCDVLSIDALDLMPNPLVE